MEITFTNHTMFRESSIIQRMMDSISIVFGAFSLWQEVVMYSVGYSKTHGHYCSSFGFWVFWLITRGLLLWYRCVYFYQCLFIINYFEVSMSHWDDNDRVETMKRGNRECAETRKLERSRKEFLEGNLLGEFLLLQKHGEQPKNNTFGTHTLILSPEHPLVKASKKTW